MKKNNWRFAPLALIILFAFIARLYRINYPLLDWHSFRQADTASVTREFIKNGINILEPTYHDLSNIQSGQENPMGYRMVEFPIINAMTALLVKLLPILPLVETSRFISILFSIGTLVFIYFLSEMLSGKKVALVSALTFAILPYIVYYSRVILPEPAMLFFLTASIFGFAKWLKNKLIKWYLFSLVGLVVGFLLKPFVGFMAPVYFALAWQEHGKKLFKNPLLYLYPIIAILPMLLWREWITKFPTGIPDSQWLYNGNGIRLRPAWFRWLGYERFLKLILGYIGIIFLPFAFIDKKKDVLVYLSWWIGILLYFIVIATGNIQHDYYQNLMIPILAISIGKGVVVLRTYLEKMFVKKSLVPTFYVSWVSLLVVSGLYVTMIVSSWFQVRGFFNVNHWEFQEAGQFVDTKVPDDAKVIAPNFGDTAFLFQTNRTGWPIGGSIDEKIKLGATHYVTTTNDEEAQKLSEKYFIIEKTDKYILIDLKKTKDH